MGGTRAEAPPPRKRLLVRCVDDVVPVERPFKEGSSTLELLVERILKPGKKGKERDDYVLGVRRERSEGPRRKQKPE